MTCAPSQGAWLLCQNLCQRGKVLELLLQPKATDSWESFLLDSVPFPKQTSFAQQEVVGLGLLMVLGIANILC